MPLKTTVIGAWPKPSFLPLPDIFSDESGSANEYDPSKRDNIVNATGENEIDQLLDDAIKEVIEEQVKLGIDVITDGEMARETYYMQIFRHIKGIDMNNPVKKVMRNGSCSVPSPVVKGKLELDGGPQCWKEWQRAQELAGDALLKFTVPGPMTLVDGLVNQFYQNEEDLRNDLIEIIQQEVEALALHGCSHIQIDEAVMMRYPEDALAFGIQNLSICFSGVPEKVTKIVHLCCGYPDKLDCVDYPKAPKTNYQLLASKLDDAGFDQVSIEDAEARNDLSLLGMFQKTTVILGVVAVARSKVETVEDIVARVDSALEHVPASRLVLAPDCGLGYLPLAILRQKLANMVAAARQIA